MKPAGGAPGAPFPAPPRPWLLRWPGLFLALAVAAAYRGAEGDIGALFRGETRASLADFVRGFFPPALSAEFLGQTWVPLLETIGIAFLGTSLAVVLAVPLSLLAVSPRVLVDDGRGPGLARRVAHQLARLVLSVMRSTPELIWALLFVRALGIGPGAGVLAIGLSYAGVMGKVFAEIFESVPRAAAQALVTAGATPMRAFTFGLLPGAFPTLVSYTIYRLDCAMRASAVLGLVGAGGLGQQIDLSMKMFRHDEVATQVIVLFVLVAALDRVSQVVRARLHDSRGVLPRGRGALSSRALAAAAWAAAVWGSLAFLEIVPGELFSRQALEGMRRFVGTMLPPDLGRAFLLDVGPAVLETLAISVLGTALGALMGLALAYPAAQRLFVVDDDRHSRARRVAREIASWSARGVLNLGRTLPELLWALMFIFVVGLGPFAGALALGFHTGGVLGRLYSEALEEAPAGPRLALTAAGARRFTAAVFGVLPQAFPQLIAYTLYRWEVNIRASAVLGVVGAGGIGARLHVALNLFQGHRTLTLVATIFLMVVATDMLSGWLRRRVMAPPGSQALREEYLSPRTVLAAAAGEG